MSDLERLRELLDIEHAWPSPYTFKFVVPAPSVAEVEALFPGEQTSHRLSKNGKYVSVTVVKVMESSEAVLAIYHEAASIEGMLAL